MDGDHTVTEEEFTERCMQLHGPARSADLFALKLGMVAWLWIEEGAQCSRQIRRRKACVDFRQEGIRRKRGQQSPSDTGAYRHCVMADRSIDG